MKTILLVAGVVTLLATSGCIVAEDGHYEHGHGHAYYRGHREAVIVGPPPVVVRAPEVILRPPEIIVR